MTASSDQSAAAVVPSSAAACVSDPMSNHLEALEEAPGREREREREMGRWRIPIWISAVIWRRLPAAAGLWEILDTWSDVAAMGSSVAHLACRGDADRSTKEAKPRMIMIKVAVAERVQILPFDLGFPNTSSSFGSSFFHSIVIGIRHLTI